MLRPSLDEASYLVVDDGVTDDDDDARYVVSHERHRDHELRVLVRQKLAVVIDRSQHPISDQWIEDHYRRRYPELMQRHNNEIIIIIIHLFAINKQTEFNTE